jgi:hypothetical protein
VVLVFDTQNLSRDGVLLVQPVNRHPRERPESLKWWAWIELLLSSKGAMGPTSRPQRPVVEGRPTGVRADVAWRGRPEKYGAWQAMHRR